MTVAFVTGSGGLIGSASARSFAAQGMHVVGIDNELRSVFIGPDASTRHVSEQLIRDLGSRFTHHDIDIRGTHQARSA